MVQTEDCLRLNVFAPDVSPAQPLPVMVFVHGGQNLTGSANELQDATDSRLFDGASLRGLLKRDVVVVTLNHRLGALGFLAHPGLTAQAGSSGNYGLLDQQAALRWVQRNIAAFGGDPAKITLFGQGSGASDVCYQLMANGARGLVQAAVLESGACGTSELPDLATAQASGRALAHSLSCERSDPTAELACLRALPANAYGAISDSDQKPGRETLAIVDGQWLQQQPRAALEAGLFERVPMIVGSNADEGSYFVQPAAAGRDRDSYGQWLSRMFEPEQSALIAERYPIADAGSTLLLESRMITEAFFTCPTLRFADAVSRYSDVYTYRFARSTDVDPLIGMGATHTAELLWVWNVWPYVAPYAVDDVALSQQIRSYWSRLVDGDPNGEGAPYWPRYEPEARSQLVLDAAITTAPADQGDACSFWSAMDGLQPNRSSGSTSTPGPHSFAAR